MTVWHNTIAVFGDDDVVLRACSPASSRRLPVVLPLTGWLVEGITECWRHSECSQLWLLGQSGTVIRLVLVFVTCTVERET